MNSLNHHRKTKANIGTVLAGGALTALILGMALAAKAAPVEHATQVTGKTNMGKLRCTLAAVPTESQTDNKRELSCTYRPITGNVVKFDGEVVKWLSDKSPSRDEHVLIWSVYSPDSQIAPAALSGRYKGIVAPAVSTRADGKPTRSTPLIGGKSGKIELLPLTPIPDKGDSAVFVAIDLQLAAIRV